MKLPTKLRAKINGYIDYTSNFTVKGWISSDIKNDQFWIFIEGIAQTVTLRTFMREDLISQNIDGLGFEFNYVGSNHNYEIAIGFSSTGEPNAATLLPFSNPSSARITGWPNSEMFAVISKDELLQIEKSIDPDTETYQKFVSKYGDIIGENENKLDVLFVDGTANSVSVRYRITNIAQGLQELGYTTRYLCLSNTSPELAAKQTARVVVFFRAPFDHAYSNLFRIYKDRGSRIIYDIDDLVFNLNIVKSVDGLRFISKQDAEDYFDGVKKYRRFVSEADAVTCSTQYLANFCKEDIGVDTYFVRNSIGKAYLEHYHSSNVREKRKTFSFSYYSGSKTHQRDFTVCADAVVRFLKTYSDVKFRIIGHFDLDEFPDFIAVRDRIEHMDFMPYHLMIADLENTDVVIAPLEVGDPYCESKSELKFFEAALLRKSCIASGTETFKFATVDGKLAKLAYSSEDWYKALEELYLFESTREVLANKAFRHCQEAYSYLAAAREAERVYFGAKQIDAEKSIQLSEPKPAGDVYRIAVLVPGLVIGGGGHRKILRFCRDWARMGHEIEIFIDSGDPIGKIETDIKKYFYDFNFKLRYTVDDNFDHDAIVCTHWSTAYHLRHFPTPSKVFYFVQDFEPMFEPVSTNYVKALSTYNLGFHVVCYGAWVADRLQKEFGIKPKIAPFSLEKSDYQLRRKIAKTVDVLFFARPSQPRRCYELGIESLRHAHRQNNSLRIALYGEHNYGELGFPYHNFGLLSKPSELSNIYNKSRVGICFSTTNPSLVGYEMISCGMQLVDIRTPGHYLNFGGEDFVRYADPMPEDVAKRIHEAVGDTKGSALRIDLGHKYVSSMPNDDVIGLTLIGQISSYLKGNQ